MKLQEMAMDPKLKEVRKWLSKLRVLHDSTIHPDLSVDVYGDVAWDRTGTTECPVKINTLTGSYQVGFDFTTLQGTPEEVPGNFSCYASKLTTLQGAPKKVGGRVWIDGPHITNLNGIPMTIGGECRVINTLVKSLSGIHKTHKQWSVGGTLTIYKTTTNILGLAMIPGINSVTLLDTPRRIKDITFDLSHHDPHRFQDELLEAGFEEQARL